MELGGPGNGFDVIVFIDRSSEDYEDRDLPPDV